MGGLKITRYDAPFTRQRRHAGLGRYGTSAVGAGWYDETQWVVLIGGDASFEREPVMAWALRMAVEALFWLAVGRWYSIKVGRRKSRRRPWR